MEKLYEDNWYQKGKNQQIMGKTTRWYQYKNRVVPVPPNRTHLVPVPIQVVPVSRCRMCLVPVPNIVVPVPQCPKCPDFCSFAYLSPNSYTVSMGTLMND